MKKLILSIFLFFAVTTLISQTEYIQMNVPNAQPVQDYIIIVEKGAIIWTLNKVEGATVKTYLLIEQANAAFTAPTPPAFWSFQRKYATAQTVYKFTPDEHFKIVYDSDGNKYILLN